jgi:guanine nucleotide-binding protein subunit alpha
MTLPRRTPASLMILTCSQDAKRLEREVKLLLLGAGASGKSTVLKQMRILHNKPFSPDEIEDYR